MNAKPSGPGWALVTGANRGIGLALCARLVEQGHKVVAVCRSPSQALKKLSVEIFDGVEMTDDGSVAALAQRLRDTKLDSLILNAGILHTDGLDDLSLDSVRQQIEVNALGPLRMVRALKDRLGRGGKIACITSRMGSLGDNTSGGYYGYRMSKAALNMAGVSLARDLAPLGIAVALLHPGYVRTDMTAHAGSLDADESARLLLERIDGLTLANTGSFWHANGEILPW